MTPAVAPSPAAELSNPQKKKPPRLSRRQVLLGCLGGVGVAAGGGAYARWVEPFSPRWESHTLDIAGLHPALEGLRIVQVTDMHLWPTPEEYLREHLAAVMQRRPGLIVLTGDFVSRANTRYLDALEQLIGMLSAPRGVFAVMGNHEYGVSNWVPGREPGGFAWYADEITRRLSRLGVVVLRNASATIEHGGGTLQVAGLDDLWCHRCDAAAAFAGIDPAHPCLTLVHNPDAIDLLRDRPTQAILCGHTHGGQVRLPLIGAPLLPVRNRQFASGLFRLGPQWLYVSRGLGFIRQVRFNCPPELTELTLTRRAA